MKEEYYRKQLVTQPLVHNIVMILNRKDHLDKVASPVEAVLIVRQKKRKYQLY